MTQITTGLAGLLVQELHDLLGVELQMSLTIRRMRDLAHDKALITELTRNHGASQHRARVLSDCLSGFRGDGVSGSCGIVPGILERGETLIRNTAKGALRDNLILGIIDKIRRFRMARYVTASAYACGRGREDIVRALQEVVAEERFTELVNARELGHL